MNEISVTELENISWFGSVGLPLELNLPFGVIAVPSWKEAMRSCSDPIWEDATLEAQNRLTEFLFSCNTKQYGDWNYITKDAKTRIITPLVEQVWYPFSQSHGLDKIFVDSVSWDILGAIMEFQYRKCSGHPVFFLPLLDIYQAGHFPCGWQGEFPRGRLMVY